MRSVLFVPGDSPRKFQRAREGAADALILDLEDSEAASQKDAARAITRDMLSAERSAQKLFVRVNALDSSRTLGDLAAVMPLHPYGIVLPKCSGVADVVQRSNFLDAFEAATRAPARVYGAS
ncbi:aldolase/citrate lyase family protein [Sulfitobacter sp. 1A12126]|uniref:aldolase/citrate lyase family protein n=1 Tax=Sulfitobacter sp. 1A12126 TaxID=3368591 RepID=UPI0037457D8E